MLILFRTFDELSQVLFLCKNLSMKNIFDLYLSSDEKDILMEIERMENEYATIPNELCLPNVSATFSRQVGTVANELPTNNSTTAIKSRFVVGIG